MLDNPPSCAFWIRPTVDIILLGSEVLQLRDLLDPKNNLSIKGDGLNWLFTTFVESRTSGAALHHDCLRLCGDKLSKLITKKAPTINQFSVPCFLPDKINLESYLFRIDNKVYYFTANSPAEVIHRIEHIGKSCESREDRLVIKALLTRPGEVFISSASVQNNDRLKSSSHLENILNHPNRYLLILLQEESIQIAQEVPIVQDEPDDEGGYWAGFITKMKNSHILVRATKEDVRPSWLSMNYISSAYKAVYALPILDDSKTQLCFGTGNTDIDALGKASMEALERHITQRSVKTITMSEVKEMKSKNKIVEIDKCVKFSLWQHKMLGLNLEEIEEESIGWTSVVSKNGENIAIPAALCHYGQYTFDFERKLFSWVNSNGCAAHLIRDRAIEGGLLECIERDSIMIWWLNKEAPPYVEYDLWPQAALQFITETAVQEYEVRLLDITLDTLPVAMFVARKKDGTWPYFLCGAACKETWAEASAKAFSEFYLAIVNWYAQKQIPTPKIDEVKTPLDHELLYLDPANRNFVDFLFTGKSSIVPPRTRSWRDVPWEWYYYEYSLENNGIDWASVVKVIVPELVPITFGFMMDQLGNQRIKDVLVNLGVKKQAISDLELEANYRPHFFP